MGAHPLARIHMLQNELCVVFLYCLFLLRHILVLKPVVIARNSEGLMRLHVFACRLWNRWGSLWLSRPLMRADSPCRSLSPSSLMPRKCFCQPARRRMRYNGGDSGCWVSEKWRQFGSRGAGFRGSGGRGFKRHCGGAGVSQQLIKASWEVKIAYNEKSGTQERFFSICPEA